MEGGVCGGCCVGAEARVGGGARLHDDSGMATVAHGREEGSPDGRRVCVQPCTAVAADTGISGIHTSRVD
eukprot:1110337-Prorocentrum_lima.AAC.1